MELSPTGLALLKTSEGFRSRVYLDVNGFPTIGYGHRLVHPESFPNGIGEEQAAEILVSDLHDAERAVQRMARVQLTRASLTP
jgi:GH24 family phage-related lysozyme (muramidase)